MSNQFNITISPPNNNSTIKKEIIQTKLTELLSQESLITPDEKAKLLKLIRKEKDL